MSERPFMQLYVSDYLGDTRHLSCEQHGAYLLLLMTMWNGGGALPDDDAKLARCTCLSLKKWKAIRPDIEPFFDVSDGAWTNKRLTEEFQKSESKSQSRASAGARGGAAKSLKDKEAALANATVLPQHLPDTILTPIPPDDFSVWLRSLVGDEPCLIDLNVEPVRALLDRGMSRADVEAGVRAALAKPDFRAKYWRSFVGWIERAAKDRMGAAPKIAPTPIGADGKPKVRLSMDTPDADRARHFIETGFWWQWWGPPPGDEDCYLPKHLQRQCLEARSIHHLPKDEEEAA